MQAIVFPGQGAQKVGMGADHYSSNTAFATLVDQAVDVLGFDIKKLMFEGPAEELTQTKFTQPAIYLHSVALFQTLDLKVDAVGGHSLGEFSALVAAGVVSFEDGLNLVATRGQLMQDAATNNPGAMAAIIGMEDTAVEEVCAKASEESGQAVVPANYNCPGQLVISGYDAAVDKAIELAKASGCRMAKKLAVSGAFHSPLMESAYDGLKAKLNEITFNEAKCAFYSNYTAEATTDPEVIKSNLLDQLQNPVKWTQTMLAMKEAGYTTFTEVGPGNVLQGLVKRSLKDVTINGYS